MSFELEQLREAAEKYTFHEGRLFGSWPCSWSFLRKKVQPSMCSSLVFFASEFFEYPSCRSVSFVPPFGIGSKSRAGLSWGKSATIVILSLAVSTSSKLGLLIAMSRNRL